MAPVKPGAVNAPSILAEMTPRLNPELDADVVAINVSLKQQCRKWHWRSPDTDVGSPTHLQQSGQILLARICRARLLVVVFGLALVALHHIVFPHHSIFRRLASLLAGNAHDSTANAGLVPPLDVDGMKDLFSKHARSNTVLIIPCNKQSLHLLKTLLCSVVHSESKGDANPSQGPMVGADQRPSSLISNIVIQALSPEVMPQLLSLQREHLNHTWPAQSFGVLPFDPLWGQHDGEVGQYSLGFYALMRKRGVFLSMLGETGYDFVFSDADVLYLNNPLDTLLNTTLSGEADIQASTDSRNLFFKSSDPYEKQSRTPVICFGFVYFRSNERTQKLLRNLKHRLTMPFYSIMTDDQVELNNIINEAGSDFRDVKLVGEIPDGLQLKPSNSFPEDMDRFMRIEKDILDKQKHIRDIEEQWAASRSARRPWFRSLLELIIDRGGSISCSMHPFPEIMTVRSFPPLAALHSSIAAENTQPSHRRIVPAVSRIDHSDTLTIRILDQRQFTSGIVYEYAEPSTRRFEKLYTEKSGVAIHGNFYYCKSKTDRYKKYSWDRGQGVNGQCAGPEGPILRGSLSPSYA